MTPNDPSPSVVGTTEKTVRNALESGDPLPGTSGFQAAIDGRLLTDVLGRVPVFLGRTEGEWTWDRSPVRLADPVVMPAGSSLRLSNLDDHPGNPLEGTNRIWTLPDPDPVSSRREGVTAVGQALASVSVSNGCPVAFSGGVDSAVVASMTSGPLYAAGIPGSKDLRCAREAAAAMGRTDDLRVVELDDDRLEAAVPAVARATGRTNAMDVAISIPLWVVARRAAADGYERLALGQGADELFGGYEKVQHAETDSRLTAETVRGAVKETTRTIPDQFARDVPLLRAAGVRPSTPLASDPVVRSALELPGELLVSAQGERKFGFRLAARRRVPDAVAFSPKEAVQYGTGVDRALDRLARGAGFQRSDSNHVQRYVESLLESA